MKRLTPHLIYQSGQLEIDVTRRELRVRGLPVPIGGRAFEIIEVLVKAAGTVVTKDDLMERVWPGAIVEESTLWVHISAVRRALGAERGKLKTISRRGYQLLGSWRTTGDVAPIGEIGSQAPVAPAPPAFSHNLPASGASLIGRERAVREVLDRLSAYRVVTLTGPGGIGKSRLALEAARRVLVQGDGDIWLVELAALSDPDLLSAAVATGLGLRTGMADLSPEVVARAIGQRRLLLLLDNCEHIVDAAARLAEAVVHSCPHATILATSREALRIDSECLYNVPPLDVPDERDAPSGVLHLSAVQLFVARTVAIHSGFCLDDASLGEIASICQRLDGIPLAIEFAAARAATLGVSVVNSHLDDRFSLLTAGRRTALARHQTLRAALDWSYDLLSEDEQLFLRALGIFPGVFMVEAAAAVALDPATTRIDTIDRLTDLVVKSLVVADVGNDRPRFRLLDTTRAYAMEQLDARGERERIARHHAAYYLTLLKRAEVEAPQRPIVDWLADYAGEIDNLRAALDWAFSPGGDGSMGAALTAAAVPLWMRLSLLEECRTRASQALGALGSGRIRDLREEMRLHAALGASTPEAPEMGEAWTTALDIAESLGDPDYQLRALRGLYFYHTGSNRYRAALPFAQKFHDLAATGAGPGDQAFGERMMGVAKHFLGDQTGARRHLERVLTHHDTTDHGRDVIRFQIDSRLSARVFLARVLWVQGLLDQAVRTAAMSVGEAQATHHAMSLCYSLALAACPIALWAGDLAAAAQYSRMLLDCSGEHGLTLWSGFASSLHAVFGMTRGALDTGDAGRGTAPSSLSPGTTAAAGFIGETAEAFVRAGRLAEGLAVIEEGFGQSEAGWIAPELLRLRGELSLIKGAPAEMAEDLFRQALDVAHQQGALSWELRAATSLARLLYNRGRPAAATACLESVYERFTEGFDTADLTAARLLLDELSGAGRG